MLDDVNYATTRLLPLLYMRMSALGIGGPLLGRIQGVYKVAWVKNQQLLHALDTVLELCAKHGIRVLLLKGMPLLMRAYHNIGARFLDDADVLIDPRDMKKVIAVMTGTGWKFALDYFPDREYFSEESIARITKAVTFTHDELSANIDVHWGLFNPTAHTPVSREPGFAELWEGSVPFEYKSKQYRTISPEVMLLHIIVHGAKSNAHRPLRWVADAVTIIRTLSVDWAVFIQEAQKSNWMVDVRVAFAFLIQHEFVSIPETILQCILNTTHSPQAVEAYYKKANGVRGRFDNARLLWHVYSRYETRLFFPLNVCFFPMYVGRARGLTTLKQIILFLWKKCKGIIKTIVL